MAPPCSSPPPLGRDAGAEGSEGTERSAFPHLRPELLGRPQLPVRKMGRRAERAPVLGEGEGFRVRRCWDPRQGAGWWREGGLSRPPPRLSRRGFPGPCTSPNLHAGGGAGQVTSRRGGARLLLGAQRWLARRDFLAAAAPSWWRVCPFRPFTRHCRSFELPNDPRAAPGGFMQLQ